MRMCSVIFKIRKIQWAVLILSFLISPACSADQETEDIFASVIVLPSFEIDIDNNYIDFGLVNSGETVTLKEGTYYNSVRCVSNKGVKYYVKIYLLDDIIGPKGNKIPLSSFKWRVYRFEGEGTAVEGWQECSNEPVTVYTSGGEDELGEEVLIQFQYKLDLPASATGGHYSLKVAYTLAEE